MTNELSKDLIRGHTNAIVLNLLSQSDSYGYRLVQDVARITNGEYELNEATLYTVFRRLGKEGLVTSYYGDETQGGRRKYYSLTEAGHQQLAKEQAAWQFAKQMIDDLMR
ncbi:MAG: PadR family transcriptional regulator [Lactobacillaceae bacterium]|jgi:PadR family transcriptional regulator PadR|nr:PadR family transcriptional regulator [Lactobacillaceae bacterium]